MARLVSTVNGVVTTVVARSAARKPVHVFSATHAAVVVVNDGTVSVIVSSIDRPTVHLDLAGYGRIYVSVVLGWVDYSRASAITIRFLQ